jgi:myo-inositol-1(or 4)-monophosphatase
LDLCRLATTAALRAGDYLRAVEPPREPLGWSAKETPGDFVTSHDAAAETMIGEVLRTGEPGSAILGEELSPNVARRGLVWIVDPIDGTTNFVHGFPHYAVSIAAEVDGILEAAVVLEVESNRLSYGWRGGGAWLDERRLSVSSIQDPAHALIGTGFPFKQEEQLAAYLRQFARVTLATSGIRRAGSAALDLTWVASGTFDGFWESLLAPWDMAAGLLLVREAGGLVTDLAGREISATSSSVVAGNPAIHRWLLETLPDRDPLSAGD